MAEFTIGPKSVLVEEFSNSENSSIATTSEDDEMPELNKADIPPEYWHIQKLLKYVSCGNQSATLVALTCLKDHDLTKEINQLAVVNIGGLELLTNLLEVKEQSIKLNVFIFLIQLAQNIIIRRRIVDLGVMKLLVDNLKQTAFDVTILAAETIYHIARVRKARKHARKYNGIPALISLLDVNQTCLTTSFDQLNKHDQEFVNIAVSASRALWTISKSKKNGHEIMKCGAAPSLAKLIKSVHLNVVIPAMGTISNCAVHPNFTIAVRTENMVPDIVKHTSSNDISLRQICAQTIFYCATDSATRDIIRKCRGLDPLVRVVQNVELRKNETLMIAVTGAIWKTAISPENVKRYDELNTINILSQIISVADANMQLITNTVGAFSEFLKFHHNRVKLRQSGAIPHLAQLLNYTYIPLLQIVPLVLRECAKEEESMRIIEEVDGVRLIWSLLKNEDPTVQGNAALSLVPCIRNAEDSGEMVRSFLGALELTVNLLRSPHDFVLSSVCAAISEIGKDRENLAIISDFGVVEMLANLVHTENEELRENICLAIGYCCSWGSNNKKFGRLGAITPIVKYMASENIKVVRATATAFHHLSENLFNCITMHETGVVPYLLRGASSSDKQLQEAAAGCLNNMRKLALDAETFHLITRCDPTLIEKGDDH